MTGLLVLILAALLLILLVLLFGSSAVLTGMGWLLGITIALGVLALLLGVCIAFLNWLGKFLPEVPETVGQGGQLPAWARTASSARIPDGVPARRPARRRAREPSFGSRSF